MVGPCSDRTLPTLADLFTDGGYRTGIFGKWHLGDNYPYRPEDRGFQETLWFPSSHINSVPDYWDNDYFGDTYRHNGQREVYEGYCTDVFFDQGMTWMGDRAEAGEPFFAYLPTNAPHQPHWLPQEYRDAMHPDYETAEDAGHLPRLPEPQRNDLVSFFGMIRNVDDNVGRLEAFLQEKGLAENTVLVFMTDNGSTFGDVSYNAGMRGRKTDLWEGGHRVPCFIRWPAGALGPPRDIDGLTQIQDLFPTLPSLCGIDPAPACDGVDLEPVLRANREVPPDRTLFINYSRMPGGFDYPAADSPAHLRRDGSAVLWKHWRLIEETGLYNLEEDPGQQTNVIDRHPEVAAKLQKDLEDWWTGLGDRVNEPRAVTIGHESDNPSLLTACEWLDVFVDQQAQVRRGDRKNSWWEIDVDQDGDYAFELRRWPREADTPLVDGLPETPVTDGVLGAGTSAPDRPRPNPGRPRIDPVRCLGVRSDLRVLLGRPESRPHPSLHLVRRCRRQPPAGCLLRLRRAYLSQPWKTTSHPPANPLCGTRATRPNSRMSTMYPNCGLSTRTPAGSGSRRSRT